MFGDIFRTWPNPRPRPRKPTGRRLVAVALALALVALPVVGCGGKFVRVTDEIGHALTTINTSYGVMEGLLEVALNRNLPDSEKIQEFINWLKLVRDSIAKAPNAEKAKAAAAVALDFQRQAVEMVR